MKVLALLALFLAAVSALIYDVDIDAAFRKGERADVFIHLPQYEYVETQTFPFRTRAEGRNFVRQSRALHNSQYQPKIIALLKELGFEFKTFWITNSILVKNASPSLIKTLKYIPDVIELELEKDVAHIIDPMIHEVYDDEMTIGRRDPGWNILIVNAPPVWAQNITGAGITVSNIDTGVLYTHEALNANYRGTLGGGLYNHDYNWLDPRGVQRQPYDNNGHGTHTMGTLAGNEISGVGVAINAKWIAAKGCASSSCSNADLIASAEYVICPTRQDGTGEDCSQGADLVSNSWGGGRGSTTFLTYIQAWVQAGSVPLFSQGNSGSACATANSPGDLGIVIGIGSTNSNDQLSSFSSRGPGLGNANFPLQKPDVSAPGEAVRSAYPTSNTAYASLSGTSMACPAVAGLVALVLQVNPQLTVAQVREIVTKTAHSALPAPIGGQQTCSGIPYTAVPNYHYGYGRIDAAAAVASAKKY